MLVLFKQCNTLRRKQVTLSISPWREAILLLAIVGSYICVCNAKTAIMQMPEHHLFGAVVPQNLLLWCESKSNPGYMRYSLKTFFCYCWPMHAVPYHHLTHLTSFNSVHSYCSASFKAKILKSPLILCFFSLFLFTLSSSWLLPCPWNHSFKTQICRCNSGRAFSINIDFLLQASKLGSGIYHYFLPQIHIYI